MYKFKKDGTGRCLTSMKMLIMRFSRDGVYTMAMDPESLERFASGSGDGVVKVWYVCPEPPASVEEIQWESKT